MLLKQKNKQTGFSFIELATILTLIAAVIAIAAPNFSRTLETQRAKTQSYELLNSIQHARQEAITRGVRVTICASSDSINCSGNTAAWSNGWVVFADLDKDGVVDTDETISVKLLEQKGNAPQITVNRTNATSISYNPDGRANGGVSNLTFSIATQGSNPASWRIPVNRMGNPRLERSS